MSSSVIRPEMSADSSSFSTKHSCLESIGTAPKVALFTGGGSMILGFGIMIACFIGVTMPFVLPIILILGGLIFVSIGGAVNGLNWDAIDERKEFGINKVNKLKEKEGVCNNSDFDELKKQKITPDDFCWLARYCYLERGVAGDYCSYYYGESLD